MKYDHIRRVSPRRSRVPGMERRSSAAFTLIELLIVVAIIAILAAIAVPNFLEAQVRSKVSRVKGEFHSLATAIEAYCVDQGNYPPQEEGSGQGSANRLTLMTSPVAYMTNGHLQDPFANPNLAVSDRDKYYKYRNFVDLVGDGSKPEYPLNVALYRWGVSSSGPDRVSLGGKKVFSKAGRFSADGIYDPTNGSISAGDIVRTQRGFDYF